MDATAKAGLVGRLRRIQSVGGSLLSNATAALNAVESIPVDDAPAPEPDPEPEPPPAEPPPTPTGPGLPAGTVLTPSGSLRITQAGQVVEGLEVTGTIVVDADDVTIRRCRLLNATTGLAIRSNGANLLIEDCDLDGRGKGVPLIGYANYTLRRCDIHGWCEGPRMSSRTTVEDCWLHHFVQQGTNHTDAIQSTGGTTIRILRNRIELYNPDTGMLGNACFQFGEEDKALRDCLVEGNYMDGGNYTVNGGGGGTTGAQVTFRRNTFGPHHRYGVKSNLGPGVTWDATNVGQ